MNTVKTCVDCKYFKRRWGQDFQFAKCLSPQNGINLVSGKAKERYADLNREDYVTRCGTAGRFWLAKKPQAGWP